MTKNAELVKVCVDYVRNPEQVRNFSKGKDIDAEIRKKFFEIMGTENPTKKHIRKYAADVFEILEVVITETYLNGVYEDEFFMQFADIRNLALGDTNEFIIEDDAILTISEHAGDHWEIHRQKLFGGETFTVKTKSYALAFYGDFYMFLTGRQSFGRMVEKVAQAVQLKVYEVVSGAFASASAQLPSSFKQTGTYNADTLLSIVSHVQAATGSNPIVVGTRTGLSKVINGVSVNWISENMKGEFNTKGMVGLCQGMTLVQLPVVHKANTFEFAYDDSQLLILPQTTDKMIKLVFEGEDEIKEINDGVSNLDKSSEYGFQTKFGANVVFSSVFGIYNLTN